MDKNHKFFGSKLNSVLLIVLIILMFFAIRIMMQDKELYFGGVVKNEETQNKSEVWTKYQADGFSFNYLPNVAKIDNSMLLMVVGKDQDKGGNVALWINNDGTGNATCDTFPTGKKNINVNGKNFVYCNSSAEPSQTYIYNDKNKTLIISTNNVEVSSYIDLGSVEIQ